MTTLALEDGIIEAVEERAPITVRGVAYVMFTNFRLIPDMSRNSVRKVGDILKRLREEGRVPWGDVVEEGAHEEGIPSWGNPRQFARSVRLGYRRDRWKTQSTTVLVVSEKGTVRGTVRPITDAYGVNFLAVGGFASATRAWDLARRSRDDTRRFVVLYVGDVDPSGMYMSEIDLPDRIARYGGAVEIQRIAITVEDAERGDLPSFSVEEKRTDSRYPWFRGRYGTRCFELDAMDPRILRARVEAAIDAYVDWDSWDRCQKAEDAELESLNEVMGEWVSVVNQEDDEDEDDEDDEDEDDETTNLV